ncbi:MAG: Jag N-terminal domain-containing protein [Ardenticatenales bacterium]|nr:Jag N-terminal domain-containing protein [Ardenticatenales bacterium]
MGSHGASGKSVEASGRTVDQAIETALTRLGRRLEEVDVQVLREASKGVLGFGAHDAIVRVMERLPVEVVQEERQEEGRPPEIIASPPPPPVIEVAVVPEVIPSSPAKRAPAPPRDEDDERYSHGKASRDELMNVSREVLLDILQRMNILADVLATWSEPEDNQEEAALVLDIVGDDLGLLIGRRGETLRDLQYILRLIVGHRIQGWANLVVDVEGYKQRRERALRQLAQRMAERVIDTGRPVHMEPMNPYERRIVHLELRKLGEVTTKSTGEGEHRRVGIFPA